jgi:hypothetical protein
MIKIDKSKYKEWNLKRTELYKHFSWYPPTDIIQKKLEEAFEKFNPMAALSYEEFKKQRAAVFVSFFEELKQTNFWNSGMLLKSEKSMIIKQFEWFSCSEKYWDWDSMIDLPFEHEINQRVAQIRALYEKHRLELGINFRTSEEFQKNSSPVAMEYVRLKTRWQDERNRLIRLDGLPTDAHSSSLSLVTSNRDSLSESSLHNSSPFPSFIEQKLTSLKKHFVNNLGYILAAAAITSYGLVIFKLFKEAQFVRNEENWSAYEDYMPTETFIMRPVQETTDELLRAIMLRYKPVENNLGLAVEQFMADTKAEMKRLKNFLAWHEWLDYLMLDAIFPDQPEVVHLAKVKLLKLEYMQHVLQTRQGQKGIVPA